MWVKRLEQYRVACMKMLTSKRQRVDQPDERGPGAAIQAGTQAGVTKVQEPPASPRSAQAASAGPWLQ